MNVIQTNKHGCIMVLLYIVSFFLFSWTIDTITSPDKMHWIQKLISFYAFWLIGRLSNFK
jgi:hypothetical protein